MEVDVCPFSPPKPSPESTLLQRRVVNPAQIFPARVEWDLDTGGTGVDSTRDCSLQLCLADGDVGYWGHTGALCHRQGHPPTSSQLGPGAVKSHTANIGIDSVMRATEPCQNLSLQELPYSWLGCSTPGLEV